MNLLSLYSVVQPNHKVLKVANYTERPRNFSDCIRYSFFPCLKPWGCQAFTEVFSFSTLSFSVQRISVWCVLLSEGPVSDWLEWSVVFYNTVCVSLLWCWIGKRRRALCGLQNSLLTSDSVWQEVAVSIEMGLGACHITATFPFAHSSEIKSTRGSSYTTQDL